MAAKKIFQVSQRVRVRAIAGRVGAEIKQIPAGQRLEVDADSRREVDGFIWWKHADGWSAERSTDGTNVYLVEVAETSTAVSTTAITSQPTSTAPAVASPVEKSFRVTAPLVRVRGDASTKSTLIKELPTNTVIEVDTNSRKEAEGFVWWKHADGWSVERKVDGSESYMVEATTAPAAAATPAAASTTAAPTTASTSQPASTSSAPVSASTAKKSFRVTAPLVRVRSDASTKSTLIKELPTNTVLEVDANSRKEAEGFVWWKHADGWSVERKVDGSETYMLDAAVAPASTSSSAPATVMTSSGLPDINMLPLLNMLFQRSPVELDKIDWIQYFGNTKFAYENGQKWSYDKFAQNMHSGIDYGTQNAGGLPFVAGVQGIFMRQDKYGLHVKVADYHIIYQHVVNAPAFAANAPINPDTTLGTMEPLPGNVHLHLEVRYKEKWIINPLVFLPEAFRTTFMNKFKAFDHYFYHDATWTQWQTPLNQPVIVLAGPMIGPRAAEIVTNTD